MLCRKSPDGQLIFSSSGFKIQCPVGDAGINPRPLASTAKGRSHQNSRVCDSRAGLLLPHRPWQMIPTHQHKEWLSTVPPLCITTASVNVILKMLQHYSDCKELVLFAITAKNGSCLELVASLFSATNGCAARRPVADP